MTEREDIDVEEIQAMLIKRRDELLRQTEATSDSRKPVELDQTRVGRLSRMDAIQGQAMARDQERRRIAELARIARALERLADGDYGYCVSCDEEIPLKRLEMDPALPTCVNCAQRAQH